LARDFAFALGGVERSRAFRLVAHQTGTADDAPGLAQLVGASGRAQASPWHLVMAVSTVMMVPIVVRFFLAQKRFIEGIATSGVKG